MADAKQVDRRRAFAQPAMSTFVRGLGYVSTSLPPMPNKAIYPPDICMPPPEALAGSIHELYAPGKSKVVRFAWQRDINTWISLNPEANRLGFLPEYLAAHGWMYKGPA